MLRSRRGSWRGGGIGGLVVEEGEDSGDVGLGQVQVGHANLFVFGEKFGGDGIFGGEDQVRALDVAKQPIVRAEFGDAGEIGADGVATIYGVAGGAVCGEDILAAVAEVDAGSFRITFTGSERGAFPSGKPIADGDGHEFWIIESGIAHPLPGGFIANEQAGSVAVFIRGIRVGIEAELFADEVDIGFFPGEEQPAGASVKFFGVFFEDLRRIAFGVDANRVEKNVFADAVSEQVLDLGEASGFERACVFAVSVDEIDGDNFAFEEIVIEVDSGAVLGGEGDIGEIAGAVVDVG